MGIRLEQLATSHIDALFDFELENKAYFEKTCLPRPKAYFDKTSMSEIVENIIEKEAYLMFVIFRDEQLVGRINITDIDVIDGKKTGDVGYRIAESETGKGIATQALRELKKLAKEQFEFTELTAGCAVRYFGSQIVLLKNQFEFVEKFTVEPNIYGPETDYVDFKYVL